jgi:hypothetical protein
MNIKWNCTKLNDLFDVDGPKELEYHLDTETSCAGKLNGFYGKSHTEETKEMIRQKMLKICENEEFRMSRALYGEQNGMFGSHRCGTENPMFGKKHSEETKKKISEKAKLRHKKK